MKSVDVTLGLSLPHVVYIYITNPMGVSMGAYRSKRPNRCTAVLKAAQRKGRGVNLVWKRGVGSLVRVWKWGLWPSVLPVQHTETYVAQNWGYYPRT